jgi:hypothetical protein
MPARAPDEGRGSSGRCAECTLYLLYLPSSRHDPFQASLERRWRQPEGGAGHLRLWRSHGKVSRANHNERARSRIDRRVRRGADAGACRAGMGAARQGRDARSSSGARSTANSSSRGDAVFQAAHCSAPIRPSLQWLYTRVLEAPRIRSSDLVGWPTLLCGYDRAL